MCLKLLNFFRKIEICDDYLSKFSFFTEFFLFAIFIVYLFSPASVQMPYPGFVFFLARRVHWSSCTGGGHRRVPRLGLGEGPVLHAV